jgi:hypothetical protein
MRAFGWSVVAGCWLMLAIPASAAVATFDARGDAYTLDTGQPAGACHIADRGSAGIDIDCFDDAGHRAFGNSRTGCLLVARGGSCYSGKPPTLRTAITVICGQTNYIIGTESDQATCEANYDIDERAKSATCDDRRDDRVNLDCSKQKGEGGCTFTSGSGGCEFGRP